MSTLTVGTWNVLDGGGDRLPAIIDHLLSLNLDLLCIQEAKRWDEDDSAVLGEVAERLGMEARLAPSSSHSCHLVTFFNPRLELESDGWKPDLALGRFHHTASRARFVLPGDDGRPVRFSVINTHLAPFSPATRAVEAGWLTEYADPDSAYLLVGDFNEPCPQDRDAHWDREVPPRLWSRHRKREGGRYTGAGRDAVGAFLDVGFRHTAAQLGQVPEPTVGHWSPTETWEHVSDYILTSPGLDKFLRLDRCEVSRPHNGRRLSDHRPVVAQFTVREAA